MLDLFQPHWLNLERVHQHWSLISSKYDCYTYKDCITQVLFVTHHFKDQYMVTCWDGYGVFSFIDDAQERYAIMKVR